MSGQTIEPETIFRKVDGRRVTEFDDGYVIDDGKGDEVHFINSTAALIYELCSGENSFHDIVQFVDAKFAMAGSVADDVAECLRALEDKGIIARSR